MKALMSVASVVALLGGIGLLAEGDDGEVIAGAILFLAAVCITESTLLRSVNDLASDIRQKQDE